jgi:hypothetical protein
MIVRPLEYIIGRQNGSITKPTDPLLFRKYNNKKTHHNNNNIKYPSYSHESYNNSSNSYENCNISDMYRIQTPHPQLDIPSPVVQQQSSHYNRQSSYSLKQLEKKSKLDKLAELERLLTRYCNRDFAQGILALVHVQMLNHGDESFLNEQLKLLSVIERNMPK